MAQYADLADCTDRSIRVLPEHLDAAFVMVEADLWAKAIDPADVLDAGAVRPQAAPLLKLLAMAYACEAAAREQAVGTGAWLLEKADGYASQAKGINAKLTRAALGLLPVGATSSGVGIGSVAIGRG